MKELGDKSQPFIKVSGEIVKKTEVLGANDTNTKEIFPDIHPTINFTDKQREENLYVLTYMKAHIPRHTKKLGRKLQSEEIQAVIAEARFSFNDDVV
jgi:hypothetical protein